jgi:hypothetical protein
MVMSLREDLAVAAAMAALYWRTEGSLLLTMVMHAAINNTKDIVPSTAAKPGEPLLLHTPLVAWLTIAVLWAGAAALLVWMAHSPMRKIDLAEHRRH